ncbi:lipopolysaccharide biosynthesis protein [Fundicoccus sp. Sow4_D5]|uniref:lipopolysaccharide biosynthesis protein n=1 Tax=Fundicoccus sp. Sow4_D5 TaxID=3438782 RepID=UPI003F8DD626
MTREKQLAYNTVLITLSKVSSQLVSFFMLPIYTSILTTEEYGIVDLLNTYVVLFTPILSLQLESGVFRYLVDVRDKLEQKKEYITTTVLSITLQTTIAFFVFFLLSFFFDSDYKYFLIFNVIINIFSRILLQVSRGLGDNKSFAVGNAILAISMVVLNVIFVVGFNMRADGILLAYFIANVISIIYIIWKKELYQYMSVKAFSISKYKELLRYSLPLVPNSLSWWLINASDRTIIAAFIGVSANGLYAIANKFSTVYMTFYNIFNMAWTESAILYINDEDSEEFLSEVTNIILRVFSSMAFGIIAVMPFVFPYLVNSKFQEAYNHIPILMIGSLFNVVIGLISVVYIAKKQTRVVANTSIAAGIINIVVNLTLVKYIGLFASSVSTAVAFFVLMIIRYVDVQKYVKIKIDNDIIISTPILGALVLNAYYSHDSTYQLLSLSITIVYSILINYKSISIIIGILKKNLKIKE